MAFSEFYCDPISGANVNGGDDAGSPSMSDTAGTGAVSTVTHQYTSVATTGTVAVGQFISIYSGAATVPAFTSRITAVSGGSGSVWVITYSASAKVGTEPTTGSTYKAQVGGAWKGPNAAEAHPFGFITNALTNATGNKPRVNLKNNGTYSITSGITHANTQTYFQGYSSTVGDGGRFNLDGGTSAIVLLTLSGTSCGIGDVIFSNNGTTGTNAGFVLSATDGSVFNAVAHDIRGYGISLTGTNIFATECETYLCNTAGTANQGGINFNSTSCVGIRCISHDNSGANNHGLVIASPAILFNCIADTNGGSGFYLNASGLSHASSCDAYNNGSHGFNQVASGALFTLYLENCNAVKNGGFGVSVAAGFGFVRNCGFGSGTQANTSGTTSIPAASAVMEVGSINYGSGLTPWVDSANGDFRINLTAAKGTGRGTYTETQASYTGTVGFPDVGAAQHQDSGGSAGMLYHTGGG
jgi:hypothetical protein